MKRILNEEPPTTTIVNSKLAILPTIGINLSSSELIAPIYFREYNTIINYI